MAEIEFQKLRCLIVDDDQSFRVLFEAMLHRLEINNVVSGRSLADALAICRTLNHPLDIIFCDFSMENGSGIDFLRMVRMGEIKSVKAETCFIMVSASSNTPLVKTAAALDVNGYVVKPLSVNTLKTTIEKSLRKQIVPDVKRYAEAAPSET